MISTAAVAPVSKTTSRIGILLSVLAILFLAFDAVIKVLQLAPAVESTTSLGYAVSMILPFGLAELACLALYAYPRTAVLGAILLTGWFGGAMATHVINGSPVFSVVFPLLIGAFVWGGLFLREPRMRTLLPFRR
ncbi:MAG TPA: DoxX family protein [Roseiflexaceae bacterium]|jgi:hypothetical protein|nr:DoxX family protein [Roseiflexaceae bacterium]